MARQNSTDDFKNLHKLLKDTLDNSVREYLNSLSTTDFLNMYIRERNITKSSIKINAQLLNLRISLDTINKAFSYSNKSCVSVEKIMIIAYLLNMNESERCILFNSYYNEIYKRKFKSDINFKRIIESIRTGIMENTLDELLLLFVSEKPELSQKDLSEIFKFSPKTIERHFNKLGIQNIGSNKKPKWEIKKNND